MLRDALTRIANEFAAARRAARTPKKHPLAEYLRKAAADEVRAALGLLAQSLTTKGSAGAGNWAGVPWLAVFDPLVTTSATRGYYVVYLFSADGRHVHLSLNQGTTAVRKELKRQAPAMLRNRASLMRQRLHDHVKKFEVKELQLGSTGNLPRDYEAGHAFGISYDVSTLSAEETLHLHLQELTRAYLALTFRGGLDPSIEVKSDDSPDDADEGSGTMTLMEARRYRYHRKIERNGRAGRAAKKHHGYVCQVCGFDFGSKYGKLGAKYIEARHLKPLSQLVEGVPVAFNIKVDFAVLCANCHRMVHKKGGPSDLEELRRLIRPAK
jgi:5-methylcytosine-specific restriction protein A